MEKFVRTNMRSLLTSAFLKRVGEQYHFEEKHRKLLFAAAEDMRAQLAGQEGFFCIRPGQNPQARGIWRGHGDDYVIGIITLGEGIDALQERYQCAGRFEEAYMAETIAWELLRAGYGQFRRWTEAQLRQRLVSFRFFGEEPELPLAWIPKLLALTGQTRVSCNRAYCLSPKKSAVFLAEMSGAAPSCAGHKRPPEAEICASCGNLNCAYRV